MRFMRLASLLGAAAAATSLVGACGLESGGIAESPDGEPDVADGSGDGWRQPDGMDYDIPDLGTGETDSGLACTCVPTVPPGWTGFSSYVTGPMAPPCPIGYGAQQDYAYDNASGGSATCTCMCSSAPAVVPACTGANVTFGTQWGDSNQCANGGTYNVTAGPNPNCNNGGPNVNPGGQKADWLRIQNPMIMPAGGWCGNPTANSAMVPAVTSDVGRACALMAGTAGCSQGICVPTPASPYEICVWQMGDVSCPSDYPKPHVAAQTLSDTRACAPSCGCAFSTKGNCSTPNVSIYDSNPGCNGGDIQISAQPADGVCRQVGRGGGFQVASSKYASTPSGAQCAAPNVGPTGGVAPVNPITICCR